MKRFHQDTLEIFENTSFLSSFIRRWKTESWMHNYFLSHAAKGTGSGKLFKFESRLPRNDNKWVTGHLLGDTAMTESSFRFVKISGMLHDGRAIDDFIGSYRASMGRREWRKLASIDVFVCWVWRNLESLLLFIVNSRFPISHWDRLAISLVSRLVLCFSWTTSRNVSL